MPFGNAEELAAAIEKMLGDPELRQRAGDDGFHMALRHDGAAAWYRIAGEFEQVIAPRKASL